MTGLTSFISQTNIITVPFVSKQRPENTQLSNSSSILWEHHDIGAGIVLSSPVCVRLAVHHFFISCHQCRPVLAQIHCHSLPGCFIHGSTHNNVFWNLCVPLAKGELSQQKKHSPDLLWFPGQIFCFRHMSNQSRERMETWWATFFQKQCTSGLYSFIH